MHLSQPLPPLLLVIAEESWYKKKLKIKKTDSFPSPHIRFAISI